MSYLEPQNVTQETISVMMDQVASAMQIPRSMLIGDSNGQLLNQMTDELVDTARRRMEESFMQAMRNTQRDADNIFSSHSFPLSGITTDISDSFDHNSNTMTRTVRLTPPVPYINVRLNISNDRSTDYCMYNGPVIHGAIHPNELNKLIRLLTRLNSIMNEHA